MEIQKITYENKEYIRNDPQYSETETVTDGNMNEIKKVVNNNADKQDEDYLKLKNALLNAETEEAKSLYVEDANKFGSLEVLGNHEQETSIASANILDTYLFEEKTVNGIALTKKENGAIVLNGTATAQTIFEANLKQSINKNGYTFKINKVSGTVESNNVQFFLYSDGYTVNKNVAITTNVNSANTALDNNTYTIERIVIPNGTVLNNVEINVMVSETNSSYVEFVPNKPSPGYPSPVVCLGSNKNRLNLQELEVANNNGIDTYSIDNSNQITLKNKTTTSGTPYSYSFQAFELNLPAGNYNLSAKVETNSSNYRIIIRGKKDGSNTTSAEVVSQSKNNGNFNVDYSQCDEYTIEFYANQAYVEQLVTTKYYDIKIEEGEIATSYSPHRTR